MQEKTKIQVILKIGEGNNWVQPKDESLHRLYLGNGVTISNAIVCLVQYFMKEKLYNEADFLEVIGKIYGQQSKIYSYIKEQRLKDFIGWG